MAYSKRKGFEFTKNLVILNRRKDKILFGFQVSVGINANQPQYFNRTASWLSICGGFNIKENGHRLRGPYLEWNVKQSPSEA